MSKSPKLTGPGPEATHRWVIAAQVMSLAALVLGLQFVLNTTGGTLFAFSAAGPLLVFVAVIIVLTVALYHFRRRHSLFEIREFAPGEIIIREGEPGDCAYFIQEGEVEVVQQRDGTEVVTATLQPGQYFGEMALLSNQRRNATVRSATQVRAAQLGKRNFLTLISTVPSTRQDIMKTVQERAMKQSGR